MCACNSCFVCACLLFFAVPNLCSNLFLIMIQTQVKNDPTVTQDVLWRPPVMSQGIGDMQLSAVTSAHPWFNLLSKTNNCHLSSCVEAFPQFSDKNKDLFNFLTYKSVSGTILPEPRSWCAYTAANWIRSFTSVQEVISCPYRTRSRIL